MTLIPMQGQDHRGPKVVKMTHFIFEVYPLHRCACSLKSNYEF